MEHAHAFRGSVPDNYDRYFGPLQFEPFAVELNERVAIGPASRVLELACGTGRVTRLLAERLTGSQRLVATDLNAAMIARAQEIVPPTAGLSWQTADAGDLPFDDCSFDTVVCQFGLMFLPDRSVGLRECHRVLAPGGHAVLSVWDSLERNPAAAVVHETMMATFPDDPPMFFLLPHSMHDRSELRQLAEQAGFERVEVHVVELEGQSASARDAANGFVLGSPLFAALVERVGEHVEEVRDLVAEAFSRRMGDHPFVCPMSALVLEGWRSA